MDAALGWIGEIFRILGSIFPRLVLIRVTHRGVKFIKSRTRELGPGLHWWWPVTTEVATYPVVRQVLSLDQQVIRTKDHKTVVADGVLVYSIVDIHKYLVDNYDAEDSITELAQAGLRQAVLSLTLDEIDSGRVKLDHKLTDVANESLAIFGIDVESMRLQSCACGTVMIHTGQFIGVNIGPA